MEIKLFTSSSFATTAQQMQYTIEEKYNLFLYKGKSLKQTQSPLRPIDARLGPKKVPLRPKDGTLRPTMDYQVRAL